MRNGCMRNGFTTCSQRYHAICSFHLSNTFLMILAMPRRQTFCNSSTGHSITIFFIFSLMPSDTVPRDPTIINTIFTFFILRSWAISYLKGLYLSIFLHPFFMGQRVMQHRLNSTCGASCRPPIGPVCYTLAPDLFGLGNPGGFCKSPTPPLCVVCAHTTSCLSLALTFLTVSNVAPSLPDHVTTTCRSSGQVEGIRS
ncbi:Hypothetical predicted protein [Octopus vulgaris]|uniref:Uncharacterized protein n=1 Tax=Octopus vulgaris TaxID=6645 RepID=A0AA36FDH5_OCTVU|nr:Hypothetical predicted protein [Octopus vulgaris]